MIDTFFYIDASQKIRSSNGDPNDDAFFLVDGKFIHGPKNSAYYWLEGDQFVGNDGDTGFRLQADKKIYGPSQHLPWFD